MMRCSQVLLIATAFITTGAEPSVRLNIVERASPNAGQSIITVRAEAIDLKLASYQGALHFAPGSLSIVSATTTAGDGSRFVNTADSANGLVRFAGFAANGFASPDLLTLVVRPRVSLDSAQLKTDLSVAADPLGVPVRADRLFPARGVRRDQTHR